MEALLIGIATAFNVLIIKWKVEKLRYQDAAFDFLVLAVLASLFSGSMGGMVIATITSFIVSVYLLASPPQFFKSIETKEFFAEFKKRMPK